MKYDFRNTFQRVLVAAIHKVETRSLRTYTYRYVSLYKLEEERWNHQHIIFDQIIFRGEH